ncbi:MAG: hypothetical protein IJP12_04065 [Methanobrevibacter sp.]|nr:hypothetical protein [Methanobrevibacter sp.]
MGKIQNRKEALYKRNQVEKLQKRVDLDDESSDWFGLLEEIVIDDDYCIYEIEKFSKLSKYYYDDFEEYSKEYGEENPLALCFEEIISYLTKIILGNFGDNIKIEEIGKGGNVEVNGLNFYPVSRIDIADLNGESFVYLYDENDLIARIPFFDITSYKITDNDRELI